MPYTSQKAAVRGRSRWLRWRPGLTLAIALSLAQLAAHATGTVAPTLETTPVPHPNDAADDPAIWLHPTDPARSLIIGTDKAIGGGLLVYDLAGRELQFVAGDGRMDNVDVRYDVSLAGGRGDLVVASNVTHNSIALYRVDVATRRLQNIGARTIGVGMDIYGLCAYASPGGKHYVFVTRSPYNGGDTGEIQQWELVATAAGTLDARKVRTIYVGSDTEGCVADDLLGDLYVAETRRGIWRYGAEPDAGTARTAVDTLGGGHLTRELEGLALYYTGRTTGYLIVSHQCCAEFVVYRREPPHAFVTSFKIGAGNGIDGVAGTDGIEVSNAALGAGFPQGLFVAHDGYNDTAGGNYTNFKLVPWQTIAGAATPALTIDTTFDPRRTDPLVPPAHRPLHLPLIMDRP